MRFSLTCLQFLQYFFLPWYCTTISLKQAHVYNVSIQAHMYNVSIHTQEKYLTLMVCILDSATTYENNVIVTCIAG